MFASTIGQIFKPLYELLAGIIAFFYALIPNFAVAIALLTVVVMIVTAPLTVKSTTVDDGDAALAPELKKIQAKYKGDRVTLNEEMMKLYKEHGINPAGGCLPMLIQLPVFVVLYGVIRGLTHTVKGKHGNVHRPARLHLPHTPACTDDLIASNGHMKAFGLDLGKQPVLAPLVVAGAPSPTRRSWLVAIGAAISANAPAQQSQPGARSGQSTDANDAALYAADLRLSFTSGSRLA